MVTRKRPARTAAKALVSPLRAQLTDPASAPHLQPQNHLLAALPRGDYARLAPHLEPIAMKLGDVLY